MIGAWKLTAPETSKLSIKISLDNDLSVTLSSMHTHEKEQQS